LHPRAGRVSLPGMNASLLPPPPQTALFLDVDGTLLELAPRPEDVVVGEAVKALLKELHERLAGALALISGRSLESLDSLLSPLRLAAAGVHGLQRRQRGTQQQAAVEPEWHAAVAGALREFAASHPGLQLEDKGHALALHFRRAPERAAEAEALAEELVERVSLPTRLLRGKMVLELMPAGADKGQAIEEFMSEDPFRGRLPVFIGDDVTDEAGFAVVNRLGGVSIHVGQSASTAATVRLPDVQSVHASLREWLQ
jgi:trehalose 6-phosphate phosphatase